MINTLRKAKLWGVLLTMALLCALFAGLGIMANAYIVPGAGDITGSTAVSGGGTCNVKSGDVLTVKDGGTLTVEANGALTVEPGGTLTVEPGGTLTVEPGGMALVMPGATYTTGGAVSGTVLNFSATSGNWDANYDASLYNSAAGNWTISDAADLAAFMMKVNDGAAFSGCTVNLAADIVLSAHNWTPIGTPAHSFEGIFDGAGHTISGLYFNDSTADNAGLFGYVSGGIIENVDITRSYIHGNNNVGGIAGYAYGCTVSNCASDVDVAGMSNVGGIAGGINAPSNGTVGVSNCYASGMVSGSSSAGGIAGGELTGSGNVVFDVRYCYYLSGCGASAAVGSGTVPEDCYSFSVIGTDWTLSNADTFSVTDSAGNTTGIAVNASLTDALNAYVADNSLCTWASGPSAPAFGEKWWGIDIALDSNGGTADGSATVCIRNKTEITAAAQNGSFAVYGYYDTADGGNRVMDQNGTLQAGSKYTDSGCNWTQKSGSVTLYAVYAGSDTTADVDLSKGTFTAQSDGTYRANGARFNGAATSFAITQTDYENTATGNAIILNNSCTITLGGVNISASGKPAISISSGCTANIVLADGSVNTLRSAGNGHSGINAGGATVNISGPGALFVFGGQGGKGWDVGPGYAGNGGSGGSGISGDTISISGGIVYVCGGQGGQGGNASSGHAGNGGSGGSGISGNTVRISGGIIDINGGQGGNGGNAVAGNPGNGGNGAPGISGTVSISGGTDTITGGSGGPAGQSNWHSGSNGAASNDSIVNASSITITGGSVFVKNMNVRPASGGVNVYKTTVTLHGAVSSKADLPGYGSDDMYTTSGGVLYLWLPEGTPVTCITGESGAKYQYYFKKAVTKSDDSAAGTLYSTGYTATVVFNLDGVGYPSESRSVLLYDAGGTHSIPMTAAGAYTFTAYVPVVDSADAYSIYVNYARTSACVTASAPSKTFNNFSVTYNYVFNGGTSADKKVVYPEDGTAMTTFPSLTGEKSGWTGVGWNTDSSATAGMSSYTASKTETLYAIYSKELTANFYSGESMSDCESVTQTIYNTASVTAISAPDTAAETAANGDGNYASIDKWALSGWRTDNVADAGSLTELTVSVDEVSKDFFAVYSLSLTGTFYSGANMASSNSDTGTKYYNTKMPSLPAASVTVTPPDSPAEVTPGGWTFLGWRNDAEADSAQSNIMTISADTDFYAVYARAIKLTYDGNSKTSGSAGETSVTQYYSSFGSVSPESLTAAPCHFSRTDFTFYRWALGSLNGPLYAAGSGVPIAYDADATQKLYAIWQIDESSAGYKNQAFNGTYDGSEHTVTVAAPAIITIKYYNASTSAYDLDSAPAYKNSGQYTVLWKMTGGDGIAAKEGSSTVTIRPITLTIPDKSLPYNGTATLTVPDFTGGGVLDGESVTLTYTPHAKTAGDYTYAPETAEGKYTLALSDGNYTVGTAGKLTITPVALDIQGDTAGSACHSVTYGGAESYSRSYQTGVNGETITLTYHPSSPHAADYAYSAEAGDGKYTLTLSDSIDYTVAGAGTFTIEQAALNIPAQTRSYEGTADYIIKNYETGVNGETITLTYSPASPHAAVYAYSTEAGDGKYTLTLSSGDYRVGSAGTLTVAKATPAIKLGNTVQIFFGAGKNTAVTAALSPSSGTVAATVQYFVAGAGWTNTVPQLPGTYSVRAYVVSGDINLLPTNDGTNLKAVDYLTSDEATHDSGVTYGKLTVTQPSSDTVFSSTGSFTDSQINYAINGAASYKKVILTTTGDSIKLTCAQVMKLASYGYTVILKTVNGNVTFSGTEFRQLGDNMNGDMLTATVTHQDAGKTYANALAAIRVTLSVDGREVHGGFGALTITKPLGTAYAGQTFSVLHLKDDGSREVLSGVADANGNLIFDTSSLSTFVIFAKGSLPVKDIFTDLTQDWYTDGIQYVYDNGLFKGTGDDKFSPDTTMSRAMLVTVLHRLAGKPAVTGTSEFTDVTDKTAFYYDAVLWAARSGIAGGYGNAKFGPDDYVTRQQMAAVLFRYNQKYGGGETGDYTTDMSRFTDSGDVAVWADTAMLWACANGIISGTSETALSPDANTTRAQVAVILQRYCKAGK